MEEFYFLATGEAYLFIYLFIYSFIYSFIYLFIYLFVYLLFIYLFYSFFSGNRYMYKYVAHLAQIGTNRE
jgi:hypothetical protein